MKCVTCGNELLEGDCICSQCGSYIDYSHVDATYSDSYQSPYANITDAQYSNNIVSIDKSNYGSSFLYSPLTYTIERILISVIAMLSLYSLFSNFIQYEGVTDIGDMSYTVGEKYKLFQFTFSAGYLSTFVLISLVAIFAKKKILSFFSIVMQLIFSIYLLSFKSNLHEMKKFMLEKSKIPFEVTITKISFMKGYSVLISVLILSLILISIHLLQLMQSNKNK